MARRYTCPAGGGLREVCAAVTRGRRLLWGLVHMNGLHRDLLGHCPTYKTQCFTWVHPMQLSPSNMLEYYIPRVPLSPSNMLEYYIPRVPALAPNSYRFPLGLEEVLHALNEVTSLFLLSQALLNL